MKKLKATLVLYETYLTSVNNESDTMAGIMNEVELALGTER